MFTYLFLTALGFNFSIWNLLLQRIGFFSICNALTPECVGSVVATRRLSCPVARGLLVPQPGTEPMSPTLEGGFLTTGGCYCSVTPWTVATRLLCPWNFPGKNIGVGSHSLLQGIFPTQELNPSPLHCSQTLNLLSHEGSPLTTGPPIFILSIILLRAIQSITCVRIIPFDC